MIKRLSVKTFYKICVGLSAVLLSLFFVLVLYSKESLFIKLSLLAIVLLLGLLCFLMIWFASRKTECFAENMNSVLDEMIDGKDDVVFELYEETVTSKVQNKLKQLYEMMLEHTRQSENERMEIQSLVSDISHQVKTPIANIKMYYDILSDRPVTAQQQKNFSASISGQIERLDFLMQAMVKMSRLETGILKLVPIHSPIYDTIAEALGGALPKAEKKQILITVVCEETLQVKHDKKWTAEALFNILDNAIKYSPENSTIALTASRWEFYTKIDITDQGRGIAEQNQASIFGRFYRERESHGEDGIGIGLYLAREIITMQGGYIKVKSELSHGATFSVFLPNA